MKRSTYLVGLFAVAALAGCNENQGNAVQDEPVKITQAAPPPGGDWTQVINETPAGDMMGNPNAKVKLVEIGALTCSHCREFEEKGVPTLVEKYVKSGQVSWEFRPYLLQGLDLPAALIARCNGGKAFFPIMRAIYKDQPVWVGKVQAAPKPEQQQVLSLPPDQQIPLLARMAGLQEWAAARGVPRAKSEKCLTDAKEVDRLVQLTSDVAAQYPQFEGTPSFILNGKMLEKTSTWDKLEPQLREALGA